MGEYIQRDNAGRYEKLSQRLGEERAREELNSARRHQVVDWELREEEKRERLEERNAELREEEEEETEEFEFEDQTESENEEGVDESHELIGEEDEEDWD